MGGVGLIEKDLGQGTESLDKIEIGVVEGMSGRTSELWEICRPLTVPYNEDEGDAIARIPHRNALLWGAQSLCKPSLSRRTPQPEEGAQINRPWEARGYSCTVDSLTTHSLDNALSTFEAQVMHPKTLGIL